MRLADNIVSWELTQFNYGCWLPLISFDACYCILQLLSGVLCDVLGTWNWVAEPVQLARISGLTSRGVKSPDVTAQLRNNYTGTVQAVAGKMFMVFSHYVWALRTELGLGRN